MTSIDFLNKVHKSLDSQEYIPTCDGNKVAVEQCSLLCSQMLFLGKNGVLYGGVLGESEE